MNKLAWIESNPDSAAAEFVHAYTFRTDDHMVEYVALNMDGAAREYAEDDEDTRWGNIESADDLLAAFERKYGTVGGWMWIEGDGNAPDGARRNSR